MKDAIEMFRERRANEREMRRVAFRDMVGFNDRDETYVPLRLTEEIVNKMKSSGAEYNRHLGFHSPYPVEGIKMGAIRFEEVCDYDAAWNRWRFTDYKCKSAVGRLCKLDLSSEEANSSFIGQVNERISVDVKVHDVSIIPSRSDFGDFCRITFKTENGCFITWFQRMYGEETVQSFVKRCGSHGEVQLTGTVKSHHSTRGILTTNVKNCEIVGKKGVTLSMYHAVNQKGE